MNEYAAAVGTVRVVVFYHTAGHRACTARKIQSPGITALVVRDPASGITVADNCFLYGLPEPYRLYTGASSVHLEDGLARRAAELLVEISDTEKEDNP